MTAPTPVRVVVAGGGTAGWIAATALARQLGSLVEVVLVESEQIGTVGVGEATIPTARTFHQYLRIDERAFMAATGATFKLGIRFEDWAQQGDSYIHSFGGYAMRNWVAEFQHFWLEARAQGVAVAPVGSYCAEHEAARAGVFAKDGQPPLNYAYHLDAGRYAGFLRQVAEADGARRVEGKIATVERDGESGDIAALVLEDGQRIAGDLFIDCTGFRALLIGRELGSEYDDWSDYLPTDGAWAMQTELDGPPAPYTRAMAHGAGWQWRIPLQHRMGNGIVFCSRFMEADDARATLERSVEGTPRTEPRLIRYQTGKRREMWRNNCLALGLSSGFVEPLESTSIHLVMIGVTRLVQMFPFGGVTQALRDRWNRASDVELERVRDFIALHYRLTQRTDSDFWRYMATMPIPDSLQARIDAFAQDAQAWQGPEDLFRVESWVQVMLGQRLEPANWHRLGALMGDGRLARELAAQQQRIAAQIGSMPAHGDFVARYCPEHALQSNADQNPVQAAKAVAQGT